MNKNAIIMASLFMGSVCGVFGFNEEPREILYSLHNLDQPFTVIVNSQNIDMFIGATQMNIAINEKELQRAKNKSIYIVVKSLSKEIGVAFTRALAMEVIETALIDRAGRVSDRFGYNLLQYCVHGISFLSHVYSGMSVYDAFNAKNNLEEALALDREILAKLEEIKASLSETSAEVPSVVAAKNVLL